MILCNEYGRGDIFLRILTEWYNILKSSAWRLCVPIKERFTDIKVGKRIYSVVLKTSK